MGMRAVLEYLDRNGDATVPHIARARRVTRQRIQALVNALMTQDLVEAIDNPASKRSPLITLTQTGATTILDMRKREAREMPVDLSDIRLLGAAETLDQVRAALERNRDLERD